MSKDTASFPKTVNKIFSPSANITSEYAPPINEAKRSLAVLASAFESLPVRSSRRYVIKKLITKRIST